MNTNIQHFLIGVFTGVWVMAIISILLYQSFETQNYIDVSSGRVECNLVERIDRTLDWYCRESEGITE